MKSIVTEFTEICAICGKSENIISHHLVFGRGMRELADKDKLILPMCNDCHNMSHYLTSRIHDNPMAESLSKMVGQLAWEKEFYRASHSGKQDKARMAFMNRYGRSYL